MKRLFGGILALCLLLGALSGCGQSAGAGIGETASGKLRIVATVFPLWDWTRNLLGGLASDAELTLLLDQGVDMHSYQPTAEDLLRIGSCDLLIYVGGTSDGWIEDAVAEAMNPDLIAVNLMEILGSAAKLEETVEGMQAQAEEDAEYDEHIWLSLTLAGRCCKAICDALVSIDPEHRTAYSENLNAYLDRLNALDGDYREAVAMGSRDTLLFADRYPFRYLLDDYSLRYYAAFPGCEAETEASFETVIFLAEKAKELGLRVLLTTESPAPRLAETVAGNAGEPRPEVLALDSMQAVTRREIDAGTDYLTVMERNLAVLREALA